MIFLQRDVFMKLTRLYLEILTFLTNLQKSFHEVCDYLILIHIALIEFVEHSLVF
jgi:hypothetical protein